MSTGLVLPGWAWETSLQGQWKTGASQLALPWARLVPATSWRLLLLVGIQRRENELPCLWYGEGRGADSRGQHE